MFDSIPNMNHLWASLLVEELVRGGVCGFCLSPGSRSTPLAVTVAQHPRAKHFVHFDERAMAFHALGMASATGRPAVLISTSGSAAANYWPGVVEASASRAPLIVLTADRPPELLDCGANQAIDQQDLYGRYARWSFSLPCPDASIAPSTVLTTIDQALYRALRAPAGPVHINCMFREPLAPDTQDAPGVQAALASLGAWRDSDSPFTRWGAPVARLSEADQRTIINRISDVERGVLVVGRLRNAAETEAARALARNLCWPVFADVASGLRLGPTESWSVPYHDQLLLSERFRSQCAPEFVLHVGGAVTSKRLLEHLGALRPEYMLVADHPLRQDPVHQITHRFEVDIAEFCTWLAPSVRDRGQRPWGQAFIAASNAAGACIDAWLAEQPALTEILAARAVSRLRPENTVLFLGNSMPVRDMDMYGAADGCGGPVHANRGASGIDGNVATAAGHANALGRPVIAVLGDLTVLHDLNSLALLRNTTAPVILVVINNNGGGIFSFLPIARREDLFEPFFGTPHGLAFEHAAQLFGLDYAHPETPGAFLDTLRNAIAGTHAIVIEVASDRAANLQAHQALQQRIAACVDAPLDNTAS
jgi:2-succinyl-5-enolpyruvyl-6-hydroxy-3-cyclohexene-1-carboxylate synthase